ncbi:hypothetical protein HPB51_005358 [Rhipicephalus microplus]|uniref:Uncharacterized protein n=1 Tax=Rhipicephalus microplus TaxID=6941 RepID=A0A9J6EXJ9_RHIMP|nr:hypothetical protein HPB51_005358 [Rhipicephalus microplus]
MPGGKEEVVTQILQRALVTRAHRSTVLIPRRNRWLLWKYPCHFSIMSVESSLAFLDNVPRRRRTAKKGCSKGAAATGFAVLSLLGVCGIAVVLTLIMRDLREGEVKETASLEARRTALPVAPVRKDAVRTQPAPGHQSKRMDSPSSGEVHKGARHQGRIFNVSRMATSTSPVTPGKSDNASDGYDIHGELDADSNDTLEHNGTIVTEETAPAFASGEDHYRVVSNGFDVSAEDADDAVIEDAKRDLQHSPLIARGSDTSNPSRFQESSGTPVYLCPYGASNYCDFHRRDFHAAYN